ncbi:WecB/TagA/CpsF family glycosyltransferase [Niveispirillum sp. KHB5.9]|uniref:WecB/TagA/CpsF family glycosyltransferase n=1 Tax=Niveispirillum sp. KHB5.9 TaxID=3400269 RepID=UPI003A84A224
MTGPGAPPPTTPILGIPVHVLTLPDAVALAAEWLRRGEKTYLCHADARSILAARDDPAFRRALAGAGFVGADGMPLVWMERWRGLPGGRVYGPDFMQAMMAHGVTATERPLRHFLFGSTPQVLDRLTRRLADGHPGLLIAGSFSPPMGTWDEAADRAHRALINDARADIVWVSLGAPRQELWMARNRPHLQAPLLCGVGAAFDFLSGVKPQAPRWLRRIGLEWAFRLLSEPRRLAGRYARTLPRFMALALAEEMRRRRQGAGDQRRT